MLYGDDAKTKFKVIPRDNVAEGSMKFQNFLLTIAVSIITLLIFSCEDDNFQPIPGDIINSPDNSSDEKSNPSVGNGTDTSTDFGSMVDSPAIFAGPEVIPNGESNVGTSDLEDGSAARRLLYGVPQYFWGDMGKGIDLPLVKITHSVTNRIVDIEVIFSPAFVDNTYGTGSIGWSSHRGHTFKDLFSSDHVELMVSNNNGEAVWKGKIDFLSKTTSTSSGYACLGPFGGDGLIEVGDRSAVLSFGSSLDDNINYYGYHNFENSPQTDSTYKVNPQYPHWQFYVVYRISFDASVFGTSGYGKVEMTSVHASPSKGNDTVPVTEKPGPVPGSPDDPFKYYNPPATVPPTDSIPDAPGDSIPGGTDPGYGVG